MKVKIFNFSLSFSLLAGFGCCCIAYLSATIMSRESALRTTLQLPNDDLSLRVISVPPSGDCFYDCMHALLNQHESLLHRDGAAGSSSNYLSSEAPLIAGLKVKSEDDYSTITSQEMRDYVADQLTSEQFDLYKMFPQR